MTKQQLIQLLLPHKEEILERLRCEAARRFTSRRQYLRDRKVYEQSLERGGPCLLPWATAVDNDAIDHFHSKTTWGAITAFFVGFSSTTPTKAGGNVTEPSGGAYARQEILAAEFDAAASSTAATNTEKAFPQATADWVGGSNLTDLVIYDASTAGTFLGFKALAQAKPVLNGDTAKIASGDYSTTMGGAA